MCYPESQKVTLVNTLRDQPNPTHKNMIQVTYLAICNVFFVKLINTVWVPYFRSKFLTYLFLLVMLNWIELKIFIYVLSILHVENIKLTYIYFNIIFSPHSTHRKLTWYLLIYLVHYASFFLLFYYKDIEHLYHTFIFRAGLWPAQLSSFLRCWACHESSCFTIFYLR